MANKNCASCVNYDGTICTIELNNMDYSNKTEGMYRDPSDTCNNYEFDKEFYEEDEE